MAAISLASWIVYILVQLVNTWDGMTVGLPQGYYWLVDFSTILYSLTLASIVYMSVLRVIALSNISTYRRTLELTGAGVVLLFFLIRGVRTVLIFMQSASNNGATNASLSQTSTNLQIATLIPLLSLRIVIDCVSIYRLWESRVRFVDQGGKEAFRVICYSLAVETLLSILATVVAVQEAMNYTGAKLSFMDWMLFSWCLASWIEQRPLFMQIFGARMTTTSSGGQDGMQSGTEMTPPAWNHGKVSSMFKA
ncbi:hypothetical protein HK101_005845 [Irineochytrium annulatum]|nr:hypothetical protein HK101_005845 [Irineochytrium annulatum]